METVQEALLLTPKEGLLLEIVKSLSRQAQHETDLANTSTPHDDTHLSRAPMPRHALVQLLRLAKDAHDHQDPDTLRHCLIALQDMNVSSQNLGSESIELQVLHELVGFACSASEADTDSLSSLDPAPRVSSAGIIALCSWAAKHPTSCLGEVADLLTSWLRAGVFRTTAQLAAAAVGMHWLVRAGWVPSEELTDWIKSLALRETADPARRAGIALLYELRRWDGLNDVCEALAPPADSVHLGTATAVSDAFLQVSDIPAKTAAAMFDLVVSVVETWANRCNDDRSPIGTATSASETMKALSKRAQRFFENVLSLDSSYDPARAQEVAAELAKPAGDFLNGLLGGDSGEAPSEEQTGLVPELQTTIQTSDSASVREAAKQAIELLSNMVRIIGDIVSHLKRDPAGEFCEKLVDLILVGQSDNRRRCCWRSSEGGVYGM